MDTHTFIIINTLTNIFTCNTTNNFTCNSPLALPTPHASPTIPANDKPLGSHVTQSESSFGDQIVTTPANDSFSNDKPLLMVVQGSSSHKASTEITKCMKQRFDKEGYCWAAVSQQNKEYYWNEFQGSFLGSKYLGATGMGLDESAINKQPIPLYGFSGKTKYTSKSIMLYVYAKGVNLQTLFLIVDAESEYNIIPGRSWIHEMQVVPSTFY